jgi:hypothetical protein
MHLLSTKELMQQAASFNKIHERNSVSISYFPICDTYPSCLKLPEETTKDGFHTEQSLEIISEVFVTG